MLNDIYVAKQGDRLDVIYYKHYGNLMQNNYSSGYNAFIMANSHLLPYPPVLNGGEIVYLIALESINDDDKVSALWD